VKDLKTVGLLRNEEALGLSSNGEKLVRALEPIVDEQSKEIIERVINEFGPLKGREIRASMYSYPKVGEKRVLAEVKKGETVLSKLNDRDAKRLFWIDDKWFETLRILFDPHSYQSIKKGLKALREEEGKPFIPVH